MDLRHYINEAIAGKNRTGRKKYTGDIDNLNTDITMDEFIDLLESMGYTEDQEQRTPLFYTEGNLYRKIHFNRNQYRVLVRRKNNNDWYYRVKFTDLGEFNSVDRVWRTHKAGDYMYKSETSDIRQLKNFLK